jgi:hypothetical protein
MANDQEQQHIPNPAQDKPEEKENTGSGGLLSGIGDPIGMSFLLSYPDISTP